MLEQVAHGQGRILFLSLDHYNPVSEVLFFCLEAIFFQVKQIKMKPQRILRSIIPVT